MAHLRKRYISDIIKQALKLSPLVGILGHRQVGKTTLLENTCAAYCSLDDQDLLQLALKNPKQFIDENKTALQGIDECQLAPPLFPTLKEYVRKNKAPGQFLLSGSVRFTSRKAIRESLTGRIVNLELLPLTISEMAHQPLPNTFEKLITHNSSEKIVQSLSTSLKNLSNLSKEYKLYFENGGLPGVCFINNTSLRELRIKEQINTILDRDIRMIYPTSLSLTQLYNFLSYIANNQGINFNYADAQRATQISMITQKKLIYALESVYLIRRLPIQGTTKGFVIYLEDQAESYYLTNFKNKNSLEAREQLVYRNLRAQLYYKLGSAFKEFHYLTRSGARIPYAIEMNGFHIGILTIQDETPNRSEIATAHSFLKTYEMGKVLILSESKNLLPLESRIIQAPIHLFV